MRWYVAFTMTMTRVDVYHRKPDIPSGMSSSMGPRGPQIVPEVKESRELVVFYRYLLHMSCACQCPSDNSKRICSTGFTGAVFYVLSCPRSNHMSYQGFSFTTITDSNRVKCHSSHLYHCVLTH
jgi:hypothetical protein